MLEYFAKNKEIAFLAAIGVALFVGCFTMLAADTIRRWVIVRRKVACPGCGNRATKRELVGDTLFVNCKRCAVTHSRHADEESWLAH